MDFNPDVLIEHLNQDSLSYDSELAFYRLGILKRTLFKKFVPAERASTLDAEAKDRFLDINTKVSNLSIDIDSFVLQWRDQLYDDLMRDEYQSSLLTFGACLAKGRCGPGSSVGPHRNDFYSKLFCEPIGTTSRFLDVHFRTSAPEHWKQALACNPYDSVYVLGSRISTVPKDKDRNRTICVEPTLNMFYQLGAKDLLESVLLRRYGINLSTQPDLNKDLARLGSIDQSLATIDLKDASDMISYKLVETLLPKEVFNVLKTLRSPYTQIDSQYVKLGMFSTMGNGFTFPLMTLLFASMLRVLYCNLQLPFNKSTFGVFGDDIICLREAYEGVVDRISKSGFIVNQDKSFNTGFFRESCGGDFYHGHNVRGIYIKELKNESDAYSCFNRLHFWCISNGIHLSGTLKYVKGLAKFQPVPRHAGAHEGHIIPEAFLLCPKRDKNGSIIYRSSDYRAQSRAVGDGTINPIGALVSALGGYIVNNRITFRSHTKSCKVVKKKSPCWDYSSNSSQEIDRGLDHSWLMLLSTS